MKKRLLVILSLIVALLPANGQLAIVNDSTMFISQQVDSLTEAERYFNPLFLVVAKGKEQLKQQLVRGSICDCDTTIPNRRIGVFSVAPNKQVSFSQGNLQYFPAAKLWKFADNQYDYLGNANKYLSPTFRNWVDLFGWSANNTTAPFGVSTSTNVADYAGDFVDWGNNWICGDAPGTWRTLSADEWEYLFEKREKALQLRSKGSIDGHRGHILLPDNWVLPDGVHFVVEPNNLTMDLDINSYTQAEWRIMEEAGAIFLPAAGRRDGTTVGYLVEYSGLWSSTSTANTNAYHTYYNYESQIIAHHWTSATSRMNGRSVRLVHDTIVSKTIPDPCLVVKVNDTLSINMMCVEGGTFMMGRNDAGAPANEKPAHQVTLSDYLISQTEVTQGLWQAVMGTTDYKDILNNNNADTYQIGAEYPAYGIKLSEAQAFINRLNQLTNLNFRLPTEAEWEYAARGGQNSKGYIYSGSNNLDEIAWYALNSNNEMHRVAQLKPDELGIYDMSGNAWEICADGYANYSAEAQVNPHVERTGNMVIRGGSSYNTWSTDAYRITYRIGRAPEQPHNRNVIRLVLHDIVPVQPEPEYVDLGLSVKWATFNVGASKPEDYGDYFAWGETEPKDEYSWATYKWCDGTDANMTKYNATDGKTILEPENDAAHVHWGGKWRMPTKQEMQELFEKCTWTRDTLNGINGHRVIGTNGSSVFLPAAGFYNADAGNSVNEQGRSTYYWTSSANGGNGAADLIVDAGENDDRVGGNTRRLGFAIRPVYNETPEPCLVVKVNDTLSINMVYVEGGTFMMGATEGDTLANANEKPAHQVTLNYDYYMAQTEVTQALWKTVMGNDNNPSTIKGDNLPVNNVLWEEAQAFVEKLSQTTGQNFYLPTEAEWEYAARGGKKSKGYLYAGSNKVDEVAWYNSNSGGVTHPVAQKMPNELGIYDMSGNVWEWCSDWLAPYTAEAQLNPTGPATGECHVYHGGGWTYGQNYCRSSHRRQTVSGYVQQALGLRVVMRKK